MKIGMIDVDAFNHEPKYPNLALMKISAGACTRDTIIDGCKQTGTGRA